MATLSIEVPDAIVPVLRRAAGEAGYPATNAGARERVRDWIRSTYRAQVELEAQRAVMAARDAAIAAASGDVASIT